MKALRHHILGVAAAVGLATCALLAVTGLLPGGQARPASASGVGAGIFTHTLVTDFDSCTVLTGTYNRLYTNTLVANPNGGEIRLASYLEDYFYGTDIDATKWSITTPDVAAPNFPYQNVDNGLFTTHNGGVRSVATIPDPAGRVIEMRARLRQPVVVSSSTGFGDIGFGRDIAPGLPAITGANRLFITFDANDLYLNARNDSLPPTNTLVSGITLTDFHIYRIEWDDPDVPSAATRYYVDGVNYQPNFTSTFVYTPYVWLYTQQYSDDTNRAIDIDWVRVYYYPTSTGQYRSCVMDGGQITTSWTTISWTANLPAGTSAAFQTRTSLDGVTWTPWASAGASGSAVPSPNGRYLQYLMNLSTSNLNASPEVRSVHVGYELNETPSANAGGPYAVGEGLPLNLNGSGSTDPNSDALEYEWDLNYTGVFNVDATGSITSVLLSEDGPVTRTIALRVRDESAATNVQSTTVTINNVAPAPNAGPDQTVGEGQTVNLNGLATDIPSDTISYAWDLDNNGSFETLSQNTSTSFANGPTTHTVALRASDEDGGAAVDTLVITVTNIAPTASALNNGPINEGSVVTITASATDPGVLDTFQYRFDCDNNGGFEIGFQTGTTAPCSFNDNGAFIVGVQARDNDLGVSSVATTTVTVNNLAPSASAANNGPANEGAPVTITASATDPGSLDTFQYRFDCDNNGTFEIGFQAGTTAPCTFGDNGAFVVAVQAQDDDLALSNVATTTVTTVNVTPTVSAANNGPVGEGSPATITATPSDPGSLDTFVYRFDCNNDGTFEIGFQAGATAPCTFGDNGSFIVRTQTRDDDLAVSNVATTTVSVTNVAPTASAANNGPIGEGSTVTVTVTPADPGSLDTFVYRFDCDNNGTFEIGFQAGASAPCAFIDNGAFVVGTQTRDDDLAVSNVATTTITVNNLAPTASALNSGPVSEGTPVTITASATDPGVLDTFQYRFDCDNNGTFEIPFQSGTTAQCVIGDNGARVVRVQAQDNGLALSNVATTTVTVTNVAPTASAANNGPANEGTPVTITVTPTDPGSLDTFVYRFDCDNNGVFEIGFQAGATAQCTFGDNGSFVVAVQTRDDDLALSNVATTTVTTNNVAPTASTTGPYTIPANAPLTLTGVVNDPGSADTHTYLWSFGDGITSTLQTPSHSYTQTGVYTATFTATDDDGGANTASTTVTVTYLIRMPLVMRNPTGSRVIPPEPSAALLASITNWLQALDER